MVSLRGKLVTVNIYKLGTSQKLRSVIGIVKKIHTATGIRDTSYIRLVDKTGKGIPTIKNYLKEYEVVIGEIH